MSIASPFQACMQLVEERRRKAAEAADRAREAKLQQRERDTTNSPTESTAENSLTLIKF